MIKRRRNIIVLPLISFAVGAAILLYGYWDHKRGVEEITSLFNAHVDSVATLVKEGAHEASISTAMLYELAEKETRTSLSLLAVLDDKNIEQQSKGRWLLRLSIDEQGNAIGDFGLIPVEKREELVAYFLDAPRDTLLDHELVSSLSLACMCRQIKETVTVICSDSTWLSNLRKEVGIGPLLKGIIKKDVLYVSLQDSSGILAAAPSVDLISNWANDPILQSTLANTNIEGAWRLRQIKGCTIFEGLIPFEMADESWVLLRVGIDAKILANLERDLKRRYILMWFLVLGITVIVTVLAIALMKWQAKKEDMESLLAAKQSEKEHFETIGQLAATVAHEVRNPLNTLKMIAQRLGGEFEIAADSDREEFESLIKMLGSESDRVNRVVTEFLDLGKPLVLDIKRVSVMEVIEHATWPMQIRAERENKTLAVEIDSDFEADIDRERFRQLLSNLIENALDAVEKGGIVTIKTIAKKNELKILVTDNGPGLSKEDVLKVMKPFMSRKASGTGLGLPLVKRLVDAHRGSFELDSTLGVGTRAVIVLPLKNGYVK